jgi:hypothetical protein
MIRCLTQRVRTAVLLGLVVLGLVFAGHGHRAPAAQDAALESGLLAGFALADLCGQPGEDGRMPDDPCPACTVPGFVAPAACGTVAQSADLVLAAVITAPRARRFAAVEHDPAHATRAPPFA